MKSPRLLPILCASLLLSAAALRAADDARPPRPSGEQREKMADRMAEELGLNDAQKAKMKAIGAQERAELDALRQKGGAPEEKRAEAKAIREKYRAQRDAILTPEQRTKAAQMREKLGPHGDRKGQGPGHREKAGE